MYFAPNIAIDEQIGFAIIKSNMKNSDSEEKVKITYKANGGTGEDIVVEVAKSKETNLAENTFTAPSSKEFKEWNTDTSGSGKGYTSGASVTPNEDMILYAIWKDSVSTEPETEKYTITYDANGGSGSIPEHQTVEKGSSINAAKNTLIPPEGNEFVEWNTKATGDGTGYDPEEEVTPTSDMTLYAIWIEKD